MKKRNLVIAGALVGVGAAVAGVIVKTLRELNNKEMFEDGFDDDFDFADDDFDDLDDWDDLDSEGCHCHCCCDETLNNSEKNTCDCDDCKNEKIVEEVATVVDDSVSKAEKEE